MTQPRAQTNVTRRKWYAANRQHVLKANTDWRARNRRKMLDIYLRREYGITADEYERILDSQEGRCALFEVCGSSAPGRSGARWHVDHDHVTGKVRGLLCSVCNTNRVGKNTLDSARAVVRYLERHQEQE